MKSENDKESNNNYITNDIISFMQIINKVINNHIFKFKYTFFDTLLNEWYNINKVLITDKISELENINSIYFYNCHKYLIYTIINIYNKYKAKSIYNILYFYNIKLIQTKLIIIRKIIFDKLKSKIKYNNYTINDLLLLKSVFLYYLSKNNTIVLQKENDIMGKYINLQINKDNKINNEMNLLIALSKWKFNSNKFICDGNVISFYLDKLKFFRCTAFVHIYKKKLKQLYNIFTNKTMDGKDIYFIKMKKIKNNNLYSSLNIPFSKFIILSKYYFFTKIISFCFFKIRMYFFYIILFRLINNIIRKYKIIFMHNLKIIINKNKKRNILFVQIITNIIFMKNYKSLTFSFYSIKSKKNNLFINKNKFKNTIIKSNENYKNPYNKTVIFKYKYSSLIKIFNIYYKYHNFKNWKIKQGLEFYFNKWKFKNKLYEFKKYNQYNNILKKKFKNYNNNNIIMKNKLKIFYDKNQKRKINNNIKEKISNKASNKNKKINLAEDIIKRIKTNEFIDKSKSDNIKLKYLNNLENLKNKNESIIDDLQSQINKLIKEIETL